MDEQKELSRGEQLRKALVHQKKNGYDRLAPGELEAMEAYCTGYKQFLDAGKTERECVDRAIALAETAGFRPYIRGMELKPGDKVYQTNRGKAIMLAVMGRKSLSEGVNIGAAHIDSPRLDLKQSPLYESDELAFFKTHYYGGIRKYQWVTIPLELHGVVALKSGRNVRVSVGN
ncbi:MAG: aminopeptidase, partial [Lawsonibacter sp.]